MNKRWMCGDIWLNILPFFDHAKLGLNLALLSDRYDVLVDKHFDGKSELTIWRTIGIHKDKGPKAKLSVQIDDKLVEFPLPDCPLPNKIRFKDLWIQYIDYSVIAFLRSNKQIWDRMGTKVGFAVSPYETEDSQRIWDVLAREILPIFATSIHHFGFHSAYALDNLRRRTSPTILTDLDQLNSIDSGALLPDGIADDGPNATAGQVLTKWLHTPRKDGQPRRFHHNYFLGPQNLEWINNFKETFLHATTSVSYNIQLCIHVGTTPIEQFELANGRTKEKLTLKEKSEESIELVYNWMLKRCQIGETAPIKWKNRENSDANFNYIRFELRYDYSGANLNSVRFELRGKHCIGPLSPPAVEEEEELD